MSDLKQEIKLLVSRSRHSDLKNSSCEDVTMQIIGVVLHNLAYFPNQSKGFSEITHFKMKESIIHWIKEYH